MISILKETTGIVDGFRYPEHIYHVDKKRGKLHKMITESGEEKTFSRPLRFDTKRRTFQKLGEI